MAQAVDSMVEKVARAMSIEDNGHAFADTRLHHYVPMARAAIAAMREPTEGMVDAAYAYDNSGAQLSESYDVIYTVMIDAALKEVE